MLRTNRDELLLRCVLALPNASTIGFASDIWVEMRAEKINEMSLIYPRSENNIIVIIVWSKKATTDFWVKVRVIDSSLRHVPLMHPRTEY